MCLLGVIAIRTGRFDTRAAFVRGVTNYPAEPYGRDQNCGAGYCQNEHIFGV